MAFTFFCQRCGSELEAEAEWSGQETKCPACMGTVIVPDPPAHLEEDAEPMPIVVRCKVCGVLKGYSADRLGRDVECKVCGAIFSLEKPTSTTCPSCKAPVRGTDTRCSACGEDLPSQFDREQRARREAEWQKAEEERAAIASIKSTAVAEMGNQIRCPRCGSTQILFGRKGYNGAAGLVGALCLGPIGLLAGCAGSGDVELTCMLCSFRWKPSSLAYWIAKIVAARKH